MPTPPAYSDFPEDIIDGDPGQIVWGNDVGGALNELKVLLGAKLDQQTTIDDPENEYWSDVVINDDGSSTATWADRFVITFVPLAGTARPTTWFNEYGEFRSMPAKDNTVGSRVYAGIDATMYTARNAETEIFEVVDKREGTRITMFGVRKDGRLRAMDSNVGTVYTLESSEDETDIPANLPVGTLIVRKTA